MQSWWTAAVAVVVILAASCGGNESAEIDARVSLPDGRDAYLSGVLADIDEQFQDRDNPFNDEWRAESRCAAQLFFARIPEEWLTQLTPAEWARLYDSADLPIYLGLSPTDPELTDLLYGVTDTCRATDGDVAAANTLLPPTTTTGRALSTEEVTEIQEGLEENQATAGDRQARFPMEDVAELIADSVVAGSIDDLLVTAGQGTATEQVLESLSAPRPGQWRLDYCYTVTGDDGWCEVEFGDEAGESRVSMFFTYDGSNDLGWVLQSSSIIARSDRPSTSTSSEAGDTAGSVRVSVVDEGGFLFFEIERDTGGLWEGVAVADPNHSWLGDELVALGVNSTTAEQLCRDAWAELGVSEVSCFEG